MSIRQDIRGAYVNYFENITDAALTLDYVLTHMVTQLGLYSNPFRAGTESYEPYQQKLIAWDIDRKKNKYKGIPEVTVVIKPSKRRLSQPILKPTFETWHDIELRLRNTMIFVGSEPYHVIETVQDGKDYLLFLLDKNGKKCKVPYYACEHIDLRSPEPQYFIYQSQPAFLRRTQARSQRQGWCYENSACNYVGQTRTWRTENIGDVMVGLNTDPFPWSSGYSNLMKAQVRALRLSRDVAVYLDKNGINAEYRGRLLGPVQEDTITVDDFD
jgi:hypothetical protein